MTPPARVPVLELRGITKRYDTVTVLRGVDFDVVEGEVHGLIGENGAGKSTTVKLLAGVDHDYEGEIRIRGKAVRLRSPAEALNLGIGMVYQELSVFPHLTVAENLFGRNLPCLMGLVNWKQMARRAQRHLNELGLEVDVTCKMNELAVGSQQVVEIARVVFSGASVIILDESNSALSAPEIARLFEFIGTLKTQGKSIIFISHFLEDVIAISDRVTILKDGARVSTLPASATNKEHLVDLMLGERSESLRPGHEGQGHRAEVLAQKEVALRIDEITLHWEFEGVSFVLHRGEILGLFGFMGAGQIPLGHCLFGSIRSDSGTVTLNGKHLCLSDTPVAVANGVAFVPENRHDSLMLQRRCCQHHAGTSRRSLAGLLKRRAEIAAAYRSIENLANVLHPGHASRRSEKGAINRRLCWPNG